MVVKIVNTNHALTGYSYDIIEYRINIHYHPFHTQINKGDDKS